MSTSVSSQDYLQQDLAVTVRVRNRLAQTPDVKLPQVLSRLLPRLLSHLDKNSLALYQNNTILTKIEEQLLGSISHCRERVRNLRTASVWIPSVARDLNSWQSPVTITAALSLLEAALPSVRTNKGKGELDPQLAEIIAPMIEFLDALHRRTVAEPTESRKAQLRCTGWLVIDTMALLAGAKVFADWDLIHEETVASVSWEKLEEAPAPCTEAVEAASKDGVGLMNLLLDLLQFWPWSQRDDGGALLEHPFPQPQPPLPRVSPGTGLSSEGFARMNHKRKGASWNELYLRQLKYICLRYALGTAVCPGLFYGDDRGLLLAVTAASGGSIHGRLAQNHLNAMFGYKTLNRRAGKWTAAVNPASLPLSVSLLILLIGDSHASHEVLKKHQERWATSAVPWGQLLGPRPSEASLLRGSMPSYTSSRVIDFLLDHLQPDTLDDRNGVRLLLDLVVILQESKQDGVSWGIQLMQKFYKASSTNASNDEVEKRWLLELQQRCLRTAVAVLNALPAASSGGGERHGLHLNMPDGAFMPLFGRTDLNNLLQTHRERQKRQRLQNNHAVAARQTAYDIVVELGPLHVGEKTQEKLSFEIPILLLQCASVENHGLHEHLTLASNSLVSVYRSLVIERRGKFYTDTEYIVAPLLPALVSAACSGSELSCGIALSWSKEFLLEFDPVAADHICTFLLDNKDRVAKNESNGVAEGKAVNMNNADGDADADVSFVDCEDAEDARTVKLDLCLTQAEKGGDVDLDILARLLRDVGFRANDVLLSSLDNRYGAVVNKDTLKQCTEETIQSAKTGVVETCMVCYEECVEGYGLSCGHHFCLDCWSVYFDDVFQQGPKAVMSIACPHHDCSAAITVSDLQLIRPELLPKWHAMHFASLLEIDKRYQPCPAPDCTMVATTRYERTGSSMAFPVICPSCEKQFCFGCGDIAHVPARCTDFLEWNKIFQSSHYWIKKNAKPCPSCGVPIEKNQGCNHVDCTQCGAAFCWICLSLLQTHMQAHTCNRYDPTSGSGSNEDERRALFFIGRFQAHDEAELFAKDKVKELKSDKGQASFYRYAFLSDDDFDVLLHASTTLVDARQFLKWSYVAAWAMRQDDATTMDKLTLCQATLELVTERLSQKVRIHEVQDAYTANGFRGVNMHFRAMEFLSLTVQRYKQRILSLMSKHLAK